LSVRLDAYRRWLTPAVAFGATLSIAVALVPFVIPGSALSGSMFDPTARLRGWREMARQVGVLKDSLAQPDEVLVVAVTSRAPVSELAYYLPGKPRVYRWNVGGVIDSQHDVWGGPKDGAGRHALIVTDDESPVPAKLANAFESLEEIGPVAVSIGPDRTRRYRVWHGVSLRAWPTRPEPDCVIALHPQSSSQERRSP
jgi:hypothetical protein